MLVWSGAKVLPLASGEAPAGGDAHTAFRNQEVGAKPLTSWPTATTRALYLCAEPCCEGGWAEWGRGECACVVGAGVCAWRPGTRARRKLAAVQACITAARQCAINPCSPWPPDLPTHLADLDHHLWVRGGSMWTVRRMGNACMLRNLCVHDTRNACQAPSHMRARARLRSLAVPNHQPGWRPRARWSAGAAPPGGRWQSRWRCTWSAPGTARAARSWGCDGAGATRGAACVDDALL